MHLKSFDLPLFFVYAIDTMKRCFNKCFARETVCVTREIDYSRNIGVGITKK